MSKYGPCPTCGAVSDDFLIPVWQDVENHKDTEPDFIGCVECGTMNRYA